MNPTQRKTVLWTSVAASAVCFVVGYKASSGFDYFGDGEGLWLVAAVVLLGGGLFVGRGGRT